MRGPRRELASASAARLSGDDYQHVFTLMEGVRLLREDVWGVTKVRMEASDAGNVDDLIVEYRGKPTLYQQVKFSRTAGEPLDHEWFTNMASASQSLLQRFHNSFQKLGDGEQRLRMALVTNRTVVANDPILKNLDGRDGLLTPRLAVQGANSASGKARARWAEHLGISEDELLLMLDCLEIHTGMGTLEKLRDTCATVMLAAGLRGDEDAVTLGYSEIRELVEKGCRELDTDAMRALVDRRGLTATSGAASLCVQAIDRMPYADSAIATVDWVDLYNGHQPRSRRSLRDRGMAVCSMAEDLAAARKKIRALGYDRVGVEGAYRLDVALAVGAEFSDGAGFLVTLKQRGELWDSAGFADTYNLAIRSEGIGRGNGLAVCLSISNEISADVLAYIAEANLPVNRLFTIEPASGASRTSIAGPGKARGFVQATLNTLRQEVQGVDKIHLFQSLPNGSALLLGHVWNRLPPTQLYADLSPGYEPTFQISG